MRFARGPDLYFMLVVGIIQVTRAIPSLRGPLANALGRLAYRFSSDKRELSRTALRRAFGTLGQEEEHRMLQGAFVTFWREMLDWRPQDVNVVGIEHLQAALAQGRGAILWDSRAFGMRGVTGEILKDRGFALRVIHGPTHLDGFMTELEDQSWLRDRVVRPFFDRRELRWAAEVLYIPSDGSVGFVRALEAGLRTNRVFRVAGDGREGRVHVDLPFLGTTARFATGMASLARATGATLLPMFCILDESGRGRLVIEPPIEIGKGDREAARKEALTRFAAVLERHVRSHPEQYRSWHILSESS